MVAAAVPLLASSPGIATEFRLRLHGGPDARWTPFAQVGAGLS